MDEDRIDFTYIGLKKNFQVHYYILNYFNFHHLLHLQSYCPYEQTIVIYLRDTNMDGTLTDRSANIIIYFILFCVYFSVIR